MTTEEYKNSNFRYQYLCKIEATFQKALKIMFSYLIGLYQPHDDYIN